MLLCLPLYLCIYAAQCFAIFEFIGHGVAGASSTRNVLLILPCIFMIFTIPAGIYLLKVNNRNTRTRCEICSKLTIKTPERR